MSNQKDKTLGKKTKKEQIIELYNSGEIDSHIIAQKVGTTVETVQVYLSLARKEGKIEKVNKNKIKKDQAIELYNAGEKNLHIIASKLEISEITVRKYLRSARKEEKVIKKDKLKPKKEQVVEMYNTKEKNPKVIAEKTGISLRKVYRYIDEARKEGKIAEPKTKKEQILELYNLGEKDPHVIAEKLGCKINTVYCYIYMEKQKEGINTKSKREQVIEMYKIGERDPKVIAQKTGVLLKTVKAYLNQERKKENVEREDKPKTKKEQIIELYKGGETNPQTIAEKVGSTAETVRVYLNKARRQGIIENIDKPKTKKEQVIAQKNEKVESKPKIKTRKEQILEVYKGGEKNPHVIAEKLGTTVETVRFYLSKARKNGEIESKSKTKIKKEQIIELYKAGEKNPQVIAKILGCTPNNVNTYLNKLREEGIIKKEPTKKELITQLYDEGERNPKVISEKLGISIQTVYTTLYQIRKEEKIEPPRPNQESQKKQTITTKTQDIIVKKPPRVEQAKPKEENQKPIDENLKNRVKVLLETEYPREIAKQLKIPPRMVYDVMDSLGKEYINNLNVMKVKRSPLYPQIVKLRRAKNLNMEKALYVVLKTNYKLKDKIELARIYYLLGNEIIPERLLNEVIFDETGSSTIIERAREEKDKILLEIKSRKVREDYKNGRNMDGTKISFNDLCRKYNVRTGFLIDTIGQEEIEYEDIEDSR